MTRVLFNHSIILITLLYCLSACDPFSLGVISLAYNESQEDEQDNRALYKLQPYSQQAHPALLCAQLFENTYNTCKLSRLPLFGNEFNNPTLANIETRILVSHQWMGDRFMEVLATLPPDILLLMRSVTAIVIAENIRPSFYTTETGAIYLDPNYLWLSEEEQNTISTGRDFRSDFDQELNFSSPWRYLNSDGSWSRLPSENRQLNDLSFPLARLLYHELAHANTFFPPASLNQISNNNTIIDAANQVIELNLAFKLTRSTPLQSNTMINLAKVMFQGEPASEFQKSLSASYVGNTFDSDRATDSYAFVSFDGEVFFEDVALLFEELMAKHHFNQDREIAYTNSANSKSCRDYIIAWGQIGRIGDTRVKEAARQVAIQILPNSDLSTVINNLEAPTQTTAETDWCLSLTKEYGVGARNRNKDISESSIYEIDISENFLPPHH